MEGKGSSSVVLTVLWHLVQSLWYLTFQFMSTINIVLFGGLLIIVGCILKCSCLRNCVSVGVFGCGDMTADT